MTDLSDKQFFLAVVIIVGLAGLGAAVFNNDIAGLIWFGLAAFVAWLFLKKSS